MKLMQMNSGEGIRAYRFGHFLLDMDTRRLTRVGQVMPLTAKLFDLLLLLVQNRGQIVTKDTLLSELWPDCFVEESNLPVAINTLRKLLGERHGEHEYIETVPKRGYRFVAPVQALSDEGVVQSELTGGTAQPRAGQTVTDALIMSLAVLPICNASNEPELDYLSDGITESLINSFSRLPQLRVLARGTVFRYKGQQVDPVKVGRSLRVDAVLLGRMAHLGEQIVIGLELVNVYDGSQLWGEQYKLKFSNIFDVQERIVREVSNNLRLRLSLEEKAQLSKSPTESAEAYRYYLKGRYFLGKRIEFELRRSIEYFQKAVKADPNYAQAYAGIADGYSLLGSYGVLPEREALAQAKPAAQKALGLNANLAEAHASLGFINTFYDWDWLGAEGHFKQAIAAKPNYLPARHWYSLLLIALGRFEQAQRDLEYNLQLSPLSPLANTSLAVCFYFARQYDLALTWCQESLELDPSFYPAYASLGLAYLEKGMCREAIEAHKTAFELSSDPEALSQLGYTYARAGEEEKAFEVIKQLTELSRDRYIKPYHFAIIYVGLGEREKALAWLEKAYADRNDLVVVINIDSRFDALRNDSRMIALSQRMALPNASASAVE